MSYTDFPQAEITNGLIHATLLLPDASKGYYRGTRFDWSGNMSSLKYNGHNYFGRWFAEYSPEIHDVIMGPVEEFAPLDYSEVKPGGSFIKIGVGVVYKQDNEPYTFSRIYQLINPGKWSVKKKTDQVMFAHDLTDENYSYHYEKTVSLTKDKPELVLFHTLKNTGARAIETDVYDHNFFVIDKHPIGPGFVVKVPFMLKGEGVGFGEIAEIKGNQISFLRAIGNGEHAECYSLQGYGPSKDDYEIRIENQTTGAGVKITCDQPLLKLAFWTCPTTICPEPYIKIKVAPGKEITWTIRYEFYTLTK
jgi:hypothetical protein